MPQLTPAHAPTAIGRSSFGELLAACRRRLEITQLELSLRADVSVRHISFLERGRSRPSESMIARLAVALRLDPRGEDQLRVAAGLIPRSASQISGGSMPATGTDLAQHVFDTALQLSTAANARDLIELSRPLLAHLGIRYFFCGTLRPTLPINSAIEFDSEGAFPAAWLQRYSERRYRPDDPLVREALRTSSSFFWSDVTARPQGLIARERLVLDEATDFGITGGFVVPLRRVDGSIRAVSMMGRHIESASDAVRVALRTIGTCLLDAQERLGSTQPVLEMTAETLDCLRWTLEDKSPRQIAAKLGLDIAVVQARLQAACAELGVRDRHQAAARAVVLRLIA